MTIAIGPSPPSPAPAPPPRSARAATPRGVALLDALAIDTRAEPTLRRYVVLDGARDPAIHAGLERLDPPRTCLFAGELPAVLEAAAPWLVDVDGATPELVAWLADEVWGQSAGVWLVADGSLGDVRKRLRRFLRVRGPNDARLMFRSYDPRVLRLFMPLATAQQLKLLFGAILEWSAEDDDPFVLRRFGLDAQGRLSDDRVSLAPEAPAAPATPAAQAASAVDVSGTPAEAGRRLRAALGERPGDANLLAAAASIVGRLDPTEVARATAARAELEVVRDAPTPSAVAGAHRPLAPADAGRSWERPFLAHLPRVQGWLTTAERGRLAAVVGAVAAAAEAVTRAGQLREEARGAPEDDAGAQWVAGAVDELRRRNADAAAWPDARDPQLEPVASTLKRLVTRLELRKSVDAKAVGSALASGLLTLKAHQEGGERDVDRAGLEGLAAALACTTGADAGARPGRVPTRPTGAGALDVDLLPGPERDAFVVTEGQLAALAAACDQALQAALERHARERHPARAQELGERLPALAARCRAKAARHGIQRRAAVLRLFDLMLEIDPEFEALARFEWAAALLDNDLIDPDAKPDMIHARAEELRFAPEQEVT